MLPNFLIIGAQKAASSWLKAALQEHPDIFLYRPHEIHFFDEYYDKGLKWYEAHFRDWDGQKVVGEKTPQYLCHPEAPARIKNTLGDVKLIASLRHPVDRAYSEFWHHIKHGRIPADADFVATYREMVQLRDRGRYFEQLNRYFELFPPKSILVLIFEQMIQNQRNAIETCLEFLEVDTHIVLSSLAEKVNQGRDVRAFNRQVWALRWAMNVLPDKLKKPLIAAGRYMVRYLPRKRKYSRLPAELRLELLEDFMPDIKKLEDLLARDLSIWYVT